MNHVKIQPGSIQKCTHLAADVQKPLINAKSKPGVKGVHGRNRSVVSEEQGEGAEMIRLAHFSVQRTCFLYKLSAQRIMTAGALQDHGSFK